MQKILHGQMAPTTITLEKLCYGLAATPDDRLTIYTCVKNQPDYRWQIQAAEVVQSA